MKIFCVQLQRKRSFSILLLAFLALAVGFSAVGFSAWQGIMAQLGGINGQYTSIAIPKEQKSGERYGYELLEDGRIQWGDGTIYTPLSMLEEAAQDAPQIIGQDRRCLLGAQVAGCQALSSEALDVLQYNVAFDQYCYNLCVLAVRCESVETVVPEVELDTPFPLSYDAWFSLVEPVSRMESYNLPPEDDAILLVDGFYTEDAAVPFEPGNTYLIRGFYYDYPIIQSVYSNEDGSYNFVWERGDQGQQRSQPRSFRFIGESMLGLGSWDAFGETPTVRGDIPNFTYHAVMTESGQGYIYPTEDALPFWTEYTGSVQDFLASDAGAVWRDEIIPMCQVNQSSAAVLLTDNAQSLYAFNSGEASLLDGRMPSPGEYQTGTPVCLVSAAFARCNGLAVGDTLELDYYASGYTQFSGNAHTQLGNSFHTICRFPMQPENRLGMEKTYEIIGIYTGADFAAGDHALHADTILVPKASVPGAEQYEDTSLPLLHSYILENGTAEEFEAYMAEKGFGGMFLYFDQDFGDTVVALDALEANALRLFCVGIVIFLLVAAVFLFLNFRRMSPVARSMRLLGLSRKVVWREMMMALAPLNLLAVVLGTGLGVAVFDVVTKSVLSEYVALQPGIVVACAVGQIVLLLAAAALWAWRATLPTLMRHK